QWYSGPSGNPGRQSFTCTLTNGTPGVLDCQDAHTVTVALSALTITKQVSVVGGGPPLPGATLDYLLHVTNTSANPANPVVITDNLNAAGPGALTYVNGTATLNGSATDVLGTGKLMNANYSASYGPLAPAAPIDLRLFATLGSTFASWTSVLTFCYATLPDLSFARGALHTIVLLLAVGAGVGEGEFVNRAQALAAVGGTPVSKEATATVRVVPDLTFDCTDVIGKVFDDANGNGHQDAGEKGLPGVRLVTTRGLAAITDEFGRFHITCAITPLEGRGSNFALKLDDRTLPSGYRLTTPQVLVERATRGKPLRF